MFKIYFNYCAFKIDYKWKKEKKRKGELEQKTEKEVIKKEELWKQKKTLKSALTASVIPTHKGRNRSIGTKLQTQSNRRNRGGVSFK